MITLLHRKPWLFAEIQPNLLDDHHSETATVYKSSSTSRCRFPWPRSATDGPLRVLLDRRRLRPGQPSVPLRRPLTTPCPGSRINAEAESEPGGLGSKEGLSGRRRDRAGVFQGGQDARCMALRDANSR